MGNVNGALVHQARSTYYSQVAKALSGALGGCILAAYVRAISFR